MKKINIVSFNIPYPPNYGGVIDVYYKIKTLKELSYDVFLHTFSYGRKLNEELKYLCNKIYIYERKKHLRYFFSTLPFIVTTRNSNELLKNIYNNNYPIILEGIHTTYHLFNNNIPQERCYIRTHNIEKNYYWTLFKNSNLFEKFYFLPEFLKLTTYETKVVAKANAILTISERDKDYFEHFNNNTHVIYPFHKYSDIESIPGKGKYILIHGDFTIKQNIKSLYWLLKNVISKLNYKVIIAGKMNKTVSYNKNVEVIPNPSEEEMHQLIKNSHICIIHNFNSEGFKIKVLHSLFAGRFCICNNKSISDTLLNKVCIIANTTEEYINAINELFNKDFNETDIKYRKQMLKKFNNIENATKLVNIINGCNT
ncbi:MAG: glycosyltransferase [Bacteroidales bacterium]|nr:glycosyltransferase [Bacteroidales bacterium]